MPKTANVKIADALIRHQIYLQRLAGSVRNRMNAELDKTVDELAGFLRRQSQLREIAPLTVAYQKEIDKTMRKIARIRKPGYQAAEEYATDQFAQMIDGEIEFTTKAIQAGIGAKIPLSALPDTTVKNILALGTWIGSNLDQWFSGWKSGDLSRIDRAVRDGLSQGKTLEEITRVIVGTKKAGYTDGVLATTRRVAETLTRTITNGVTNSARDEFYERNSDILDGLEFTAVLDARTSEICASLDGNVYAVNDPKRPLPPLHPNCRCVYVPVVSGFGVVGDRPSVGGTNFNTAARDEYIDKRISKGDSESDARAKWANLSNSAKNKMRNEQIEKWGKDVIGSAPEKQHITTG